MTNDMGVMLLPVNTGLGRRGAKYYIKGDVSPSFPCLCHYRTTVSRTWGGPPTVVIEQTCGDYLKNMFLPMLCCCGGYRETVTGDVGGAIYRNPATFTNMYKADGQDGAVSVNSRLWTKALWLAQKSFCDSWVFITSGGTVDYFVANGNSGKEIAGIHADHTYSAWSGCCCCKPGSGKSCCVFPTCCPSAQATTVVKGDRMTPGGAPVVGHLTVGIERRCCLSPCPAVTGGVITVPQELPPNDLMAWVLLWRTSLSNLYQRDRRGLENWVGYKPLQNVEEMQ